MQAYRDNGGIAGILDRHAEDVLREAVGELKERRKIAESLFRRLSERDAEGRYRRSPTSAEKLCSIVGCKPDELQQVIRPFEHPDVCFLEQRPSKSANEVLVDVSHESLIRQWSTAKGWADAEAEKVRKFRELAYSAVSWERRKRSPDFLKRRGELEVINAWWSEEAPNENWTRRYTLTPEGGNLTEAFQDVKEYLRVSSETDRAEQAAAERERVKQVSERSRRQRNRVFVAAVVLLLFGAIAAGAFVWQTKQYDAYRVRVASLLAEEALRIFGPARALLAAMEGIDDVLPELPQMQRVGYRALAQLRERRILEDPAASPVQGVQFAPHQPVLITTTQNGWLRFWKLETGELIDSYLVGGRFLTARWSPDGTQLFVSARDVDAIFSDPLLAREAASILFGMRLDHRGQETFVQSGGGDRVVQPRRPLDRHRSFLRNDQALGRDLDRGAEKRLRAQQVMDGGRRVQP